jgi:hypothetical protein
MASQHRKHRGYRTQKVVAEFLQKWFPYADSAGAGRQGSDITGVPFDIEVKARSAFQPKEWLDQARKRSDGKLSVVVMRFNGQGEDAGEYGAMLRFSDLIQLLNKVDYAEWFQEPSRCKGCGTWLISSYTYCTKCEEHNASL